MARQNFRTSCAADILNFRQTFGANFGNETVFLVEISDIVSGEHEDRRGGTTKF